jgi:ABC-type glycerol-3-phosphate transport system substrate-binding protein
MTKFQIILTGVLGGFIVIGVIAFATVRTSGTTASAVTVWGTMQPATFSSILDASGLAKDKTFNITYVKKDQSSFQNDFIEALASGTSPDLIITTQDKVLENKDKLYAIPYSSISKNDFSNAFISEAELLMLSDGIYGLPFVVDPMVMYWNRTMFSNKGVSQPPQYWSQLFDLVKLFTVRDASLSISKTAVALGEYTNVNHANDLLSLLSIQAGTPIVNQGQGGLQSVLAERFGYTLVPAEAALDFYTSFANPAKTFYAWNRSLPNSQDMFVAGNLALYFGYASEITLIQAKNPNLDFNVTTMLQNEGGDVNTTFGELYVMSIPKRATDITGAFKLAVALSGQTGNSAASSATGLPPVRRDLLATKPESSYGQTFFTSALWSKAWLDPNSNATEKVFKDMIENVTSGKLRVSQAVGQANSTLQTLLSPIK